ncbi:MAG TPA: SurA N-terminal domain-containing protein [Candidatus Omnitrophota bacterium]|nr:SurA N-terminal domain-containing protein [Candidatus Omnitrophota bacterium]HQO57240.1 SurA N-terminal domain-containing protein [Candidatus Omnitrophota bacterium]HQP11642.1 SurA N-terminal domain-containing protein [Candidatus Omnitrophota bacterium]
MLKVIRHKGFMKKTLWALAVIIIISFGFFGQSFLFRDSSKATYAGKIFGKKISIQEYDFNRTQTDLQLRLQYGSEYKKIADFINIFAQTWDRLILLYEADRQHIKVTDEMIVSTIQTYPFFLKNGVFNQSLYNQILKNAFHIQPRDFEEGMRDSLKIAKLFEKQTENITVPEEEVLKIYTQHNEKVQVTYGMVSTDQYLSGIPFDEVQAKNYYLSHKEEFMLPPMINVAFIQVDFPLNPPAHESDGEAEKTPSENNGEIPENPEAAGEPAPPLAEAKNAVSDADKETAWQAAQDLADAILIDNKNFETVALENQKNVGESGFFSLEKPNLSLGWSFPLIQQLFELPKGQILGPVETPGGYQILQVKDRRESTIPDYPTVQNDVKIAWTRAEAKKIAKAKADEFIGQTRETLNQAGNPGFKTIAENLGLPVFQTPVFQRGEYLPNVGLSRDFQEAAFALKNSSKVSDPVEVEKGFCFLMLDSYIPVDMEKYKKEKAPYLEKILQEKKAKAFEEFLARLKVKANLEDHTSELYRMDTTN